MTRKRSNPHDSLARWMLNRPQNAAAIIRPNLPPAVAAEIDWDNLELVPSNFVDPELRNRVSDLVFRTRISGRPGYINCLLEHQSSSDRFMAFRLLEYTVRLWSGYLADNRRANTLNPDTVPKATTLPVVIPVVLHVNSDGTTWPTTAPTELADLYDIDPATRAALGPHLARMEFILDDVATQDVSQIQTSALPPAVRLTLTLLRAAPGNTNLGTIMMEMLDDLETLNDGPDPLGDMIVTLTYLVTVGNTPESELARVFEKLGPHGKEAIVTTADRIEARGEARGIAKGEALGEAKGRTKVLLELMTTKFGTLPTTTVERVKSAGSTQINTWVTRILTASTLDELLA
ncbi:Rpn family recombination-promoting nuclease/putative transposase [Nocardia macrotermitis]|uniref:Transposase (putative) YhgA-like domain-containing protein n=1 Tax=Nocardia macrotermitis TaxID=2585198 RepID=A0A7K0D724_9NOCA|nr:Rpn family recombination-promoting nuclease/putative transposase [Nocardia macrotermitis]MQY21517.1 hypothetical protein [Nocardia macrotermitis]